jgi:hypothetical protein
MADGLSSGYLGHRRDGGGSPMSTTATNNDQPPSHPVGHFLSGGGELGALMRSYDWETTPLGPPASCHRV